MANRDNDSAVTLVSRRILPSLEEIQSSQDTVALLAESSLSETEEAREGETDSQVDLLRSCSSTTINRVPKNRAVLELAHVNKRIHGFNSCTRST